MRTAKATGTYEISENLLYLGANWNPKMHIPLNMVSVNLMLPNISSNLTYTQMVNILVNC